MDKKALTAIVLCAAVWLIWAQVFQQPTRERNTNAASKAKEDQPFRGAVSSVEKQVGEQAKSFTRKNEKIVVIRNAKMEVVVSNYGAGLMHLNLNDFAERNNTKERGNLGKKDLVTTHEESVRPLAIRFNPEKTTFHLSPIQDWEVVRNSDLNAVLRLENQKDNNIPVITKQFMIVDEYEMDLYVEIENRSEENIQEQIILELFAENQPAVRTGCAGVRSVSRNPLCMTGKEVFPSSSACGSARSTMKPGDQKRFSQRVHWTGINEQYFLMAAIPLDTTPPVCILKSGFNDIVTSSLMYPETVIAPGAKKTHRFRIFAGPRELTILEKVNTGKENQSAKLSASVDYGWFSFLCYPMLWLLKKFFGVVGNYGIAIILLTILIKLLLLPLTHKSMKSMRKMAKLKPLMQELKEQYRDDKQRLNQEMMNMYRSRKVNPAGGCLPMILQAPIWISLYRMLYTSVELYQAPFIRGWLEDLSYRDPVFVLPIVVGLTMFLQQKLSPSRDETKQAKAMLFVMPAFFTFVMLYLPSGLVLYIFTSSLLSIGHQMIYRRMGERKKTSAIYPVRSE